MASFASGLVGGYANEAEKKRSSLTSMDKKLNKRVNSALPARLSSPPPATTSLASPAQYKKGGKVKRGGWAKVHKNEKVMTAKQARKMKHRRGGSRR
jgi:hypothetical protein